MARPIAAVFGLLTSAMLMAPAPQAAASTIYATFYDEDVSGDLPGIFEPLPLINLSVGLNTVSGVISARRGAGDRATDFDSFSFRVAPGTILEAVSITASLIPELSTVSFSQVTEYELLPRGGFVGDEDLFNHVEIPLTGSVTQSLFTSQLPVGAGFYDFAHVGISTVPGQAWAADYTVSLQVVPLPGTLSMLGLGLAGLGLAGLRRTFAGGR